MFAMAIDHIAANLDDYVKSYFGVDEQIVVVSSLVNNEGKPSQEINNKLVVTLINVDKEATLESANIHNTNPHSLAKLAKPLRVNLGVLISAHFTEANYLEALKVLSVASTYFHIHTVFNHQNTPSLSQKIEKLSVELENLSIREMSNMWSMLGTKHTPCLFYRIRSVVLNSESVLGRIHLVEQVDATVSVDQ